MKKKYTETLLGLFWVFLILMILVFIVAVQFIAVFILMFLIILVIFTGLSIHDALEQLNVQIQAIKESIDKS